MKEVFENFSKKYLSEEGTISGKSFLFRTIILSIVLGIIYEYIWFTDSIEVNKFLEDVFNYEPKKRVKIYFGLIAAVIGELPLLISIIIDFNLFTKRIRAFKYKIIDSYRTIWLILWYFIGFVSLFSTFVTEKSILEMTYNGNFLAIKLYWSFLLLYLLFFFFLCFKNSPITDSKQHEG